MSTQIEWSRLSISIESIDNNNNNNNNMLSRRG